MNASGTSGDHGGRRTKIIATVGPASWAPEVLEQLVAAGADVCRLNFSHAGPERQAETIAAIRGAAERVGCEVAILGDLPGPKLRIGSLRGDVAELETGMHVTLTPEEVVGEGGTIPVSWAGVSDLEQDQLVYLADGAIRLRVGDKENAGVGAEVEVGGNLSSHKGMNIPGGVDLPRRQRRDHGRPVLPRDRSAPGAAADRSEAPDPRRRQGLETVDHCDPDAGLDGDREPPDQGRGDRRR